MPKNDYVTASEIGDYVFCKRSWWLKFKGYSQTHTIQMERGTIAHDSLARSLKRNKYVKVLGLVFLVVAILSALLYFFYG